MQDLRSSYSSELDSEPDKKQMDSIREILSSHQLMPARRRKRMDDYKRKERAYLCGSPDAIGPLSGA